MTITVIKQGTQWVARFPFSVEVKDKVKRAGFRFDGFRKIWYTADPQIAAKLDSNVEIEAEIRRAREQAAASVQASRAADAAVTIPAPNGCEYLPYQKAGIAYAMARRDTLVGDEMGLGKTIQALGVINADPTINNTLVICPASLKLNWVREARKWLVRPTRITLANGMFPASGLVVLNYEMIGKYRRQIDSVQWDLLVIDESHYLKSPKAQRTHAILGQWSPQPENRIAPIAARRRLFLSGTPILNRPAELWTLLKALDPSGLGENWKYFHTRYCGAYKSRYGWDITGASHLDELQNKLRETIMVRRLKSDVLTELPAKRRQIITLIPEGAAAKAAVAREQQVIAETEARLNGLRAQVEALSVDEASEAYKQAAFDLRQAYSVAFEETSLVRHEVALAKLPQVIAHIEDCLESEDKIVVFAWHHDVIDALALAFGRAHGNVPEPDGQAIWQMEGYQESVGGRSKTSNVVMPMPMRPDQTGNQPISDKRSIERLSQMSAAKAWSGTSAGLSDVGSIEGASQKSGGTFQHTLVGHSDTGDMSGIWHPDQVQQSTLQSGQSLTGPDRPEKRLHEGQHLGHFVASQRDKTRRDSAGTGTASKGVKSQVAIVDGRVPIAQRQAEIDRFQADPECRLFIGSIAAAGVGFTLTSASHVIFAELDWTPGILQQAEDRLHRIGQRNQVLVQHIVLDGSLDARMAELIVSKMGVIAEAMDAAP